MRTAKRAILCAASIAMLAAPATADAHLGFSILHMQPYYSRPHHWYTNDGRKASDDFNHTGEPTVSVHNRKDEHRNQNESHRLLHRHVTTACDRLRAMYIMRHGFGNKPHSLRREFGCELWADDDFYHETHLTEAFDVFGIGN